MSIQQDHDQAQEQKQQKTDQLYLQQQINLQLLESKQDGNQKIIDLVSSLNATVDQEQPNQSQRTMMDQEQNNQDSEQSQSKKDIGIIQLLAMCKQDCSLKSFVVISCFIIIPVLIATGTILLKNKILEELIYFDEWFQSNPVLGFFGFISMYFIWVPFNLPNTILSLLGGYMFSKMYGAVLGFFICIFAMYLGFHSAAILTFQIGRKYLKNTIQKNLINQIRIFQALDQSFEKEGIKIVVLVRLQPAIPLNLQNYILCSLKCKIKDFILGSLIGVTPGFIIFPYIGINLSSIQQSIEGKRQFSVVEIVGFTLVMVVVLILLVIIAKEGKSQLQNIIDQAEDKKKEDQKEIRQ